RKLKEEQQVKELKGKFDSKYPVETRKVGKKIESRDGKLIHDNTEIWALVGKFSSKSEALKLCDEISGIQVVDDFISRGEGSIKILTPDGREAATASIAQIEPIDAVSGRVCVFNVPVGKGFHWEHSEDQLFRGKIEFRINNYGGIAAINELPLNEYLASVNSSEARPQAPLELLKAQTVVARGTALVTMGRHHFNEPFDLCNSDHCQVYKGSGVEKSKSIEAVNSTFGEVLTHKGEICDTRFAAICGGITENFENVWFEESKPYLTSIIDAADISEIEKFFPADTEERAKNFIDAESQSYCNTLREGLPAYLNYAKNCFRWQVSYKREELEQIIKEKTGKDIRRLLDILPLKRGNSGRIINLELKGDKRTIKIRSELAIRMALSKSCLLSSCFYVETKRDKNGIPVSFTLHGAGWGHGVGMCQIGAALMAEQGKKYREILHHYYRDSRIKKVY
ncbi:MAG TPA: SpoIID/LytB domain-containing protein, partial [bacterium (Candidatus Stahlbacteria)]|nr:SpoIID/LytB domain-containing protein [Candidatus Stahlbacteria bacterium]